jgi:siroheme synthase
LRAENRQKLAAISLRREEAPASVERVYAGKESTSRTLDQDLINEILIMHVRLVKTGGPAQGGRRSGSSVAIVARGTRCGQRTDTGTLKSFRDSPPDAQPPAVIVAGQVVLLQGRVLWFSESLEAVDKVEAGSV